MRHRKANVSPCPLACFDDACAQLGMFWGYFACLCSVRRSVLVRHHPPAVDGDDREVVVGIGDGVAVRAVADLEVDNFLVGFVDEVMSVAASRLEAGAHAGLKSRPTGVRDQDRAPFKDIDELVLLRVRMAQSRGAAWRKTRDVDAEIRQPEQVSERPLVASGHARGERLGIIGAKRAGRRLGGEKGDGTLGVFRHGLTSAG